MSTSAVEAIPQTFKKPSVAKKARAFFLATSGTVLEYYDYALYGLFAPLFAQDFFPHTDPTVALLQIFAIFFVGSLAKPLGSIIFGIMGDRWGAGRALKISIIGMAIATFAIGILPGYATWGSFAAFCLVLCRFVQGMSVIGESDSMQVFIYEHFGNQRSCVVNSLCCMSWKIGISLGSVAYAWVMQQSDPLSYYRWPFIVGAGLGLLIFWFRSRFVEETQSALRLRKESGSLSDMLRVILRNKILLLATLCLCGACGGAYHFYFSFLNHYSQQLSDVHLNFSPFFMPYGLLAYTLSSLVGALMADKIGPLLLMRITGRVLLLLSLLHVWAMMNGQLPFVLMGATIIGLGIFQAPGFVTLFARVAAHERCRTIFLGHAMGALLFSGSTPFISLWLWHRTHWVGAPFVYFVFLMGLGLLAVCLLEQQGPIPNNGPIPYAQNKRRNTEKRKK